MTHNAFMKKIRAVEVVSHAINDVVDIAEVFAMKTEAQLKAEDVKRFGPMLSRMNELTEEHGLLAGENIYLLTLLLLGSIQDAPDDVRELFRGAAVQALLRERDSGRVLRELCLDGRLPR